MDRGEGETARVQPHVALVRQLLSMRPAFVLRSANRIQDLSPPVSNSNRIQGNLVNCVLQRRRGRTEPLIASQQIFTSYLDVWRFLEQFLTLSIRTRPVYTQPPV